MYKLVSNDPSIQPILLSPNSPLTIGRETFAGAKDKRVSRQHCIIKVDSNARVIVKQLGCNGTQIIRHKCKNPIRLAKGETRIIHNNDKLNLITTEPYFDGFKLTLKPNFPKKRPIELLDEEPLPNKRFKHDNHVIELSQVSNVAVDRIDLTDSEVINLRKASQNDIFLSQLELSNEKQQVPIDQLSHPELVEMVAKKDENIKSISEVCKELSRQIHVLTGGLGYETTMTLKKIEIQKRDREAQNECQICNECYSAMRPRDALSCFCPQHNSICIRCHQTMPYPRRCPFCRKLVL